MDISFPDLDPQDTDSPLILRQKLILAVRACTAAVAGIGGGGGGGNNKVQAADQSKTSDTSLADITDLVAAVSANATYHFRATLFVNEAGATAGLKTAATCPAAGSIQYQSIFQNTTSTFTPNGPPANASGTAQVRSMASGLAIVVIEGILINGANAGNLAIQFAQNTSDANATTIKAGSTLLVTQIP